VEIAVFGLAMAAWRFPNENGKPLGVRRGMPTPQVACCGLKLSATIEQWQALVPSDAPDADRLRAGLAQLHRTFSQAPLLGSLLHPARASEANLLEAGSEDLAEFLNQALGEEQPLGYGSDVDQAVEMAMTARGLLDAGRLLNSHYQLVVTNVPYLARGKQHESLREYSETHYKDAKGDLANVFLERCLELSENQGRGVVQLVMPQNWLFLSSYQKQRESLLRGLRWNFLVKLGPGAFETLNSKVVQAILLTNTNLKSNGVFRGIDASEVKTIADKSAYLREGSLLELEQSALLSSPHFRISLEAPTREQLLEDFANPYQGITTGDNPRFIRMFWELCSWGEDWIGFQSTSDLSSEFGGREQVLLWENGNGLLAGSDAARIQGQPAWGRDGVTVRQMGGFAATINKGSLWDMNSTTFVPRDTAHLLAIWCFCSSSAFKDSIRKIDQSFKVTTATMGRVPFDLSHWEAVARVRYPGGMPDPYSREPTQWIFHGHPFDSGNPLQVAVARLCGYEWPAEKCADIELSKETTSWVLGLGGLADLSDKDGIVCLPSVRGEPAAHDRLAKLLALVYGNDWSSAKERELLLTAAVEGNTRKPEPSLKTWLRNSFFGEHCKQFLNRPFILQIWDGNPTGFSALVNAHKLAAPNGQGRKTLELLTFTYLGDWINRQKLEQSEGVSGADDRLASAIDLQGQLKKILEGEPPYDIFVRWKPLSQQPIGWDPDINDGVRLNIRPFLNAELRKGSKTAAGILRAKPGTIKWAKDRGKEPLCSKEDFPWFWGWAENSPPVATDFGAPVPGAPPAGDSFDGNRWNDLHYTRAAKEAARARNGGVS